MDDDSPCKLEDVSPYELDDSLHELDDSLHELDDSQDKLNNSRDKLDDSQDISDDGLDEKRLYERDDLVDGHLRDFLRDNPVANYESTAYWAMVAAREYMKIDDSTTMQEIIVRLKRLKLRIENSPVSTPGVSCGFKMLLMFMTREPVFLEDAKTLEDLRSVILASMNDIMGLMSESPNEIGKTMSRMLGSEKNVILTRNWNLAVLALCRECVRAEKDVRAIVLGDADDRTRMVDALTAAGVNAIGAKDSLMAYYMEEATIVALGCDSVCDSGGAYVPIGQLPVVLVANQLKKKVYIMAELYKFTDVNADDTREYAESAERILGCTDKPLNVELIPQEHITRVFTDPGSVHGRNFQYIRENINN